MEAFFSGLSAIMVVHLNGALGQTYFQGFFLHLIWGIPHYPISLGTLRLFFTAIPDMGFQSCNSTKANHIKAHMALLYVAGTLAYLFQIAANKKAGDGETVTQ